MTTGDKPHISFFHGYWRVVAHEKPWKKQSQPTRELRGKAHDAVHRMNNEPFALALRGAYWARKTAEYHARCEAESFKQMQEGL
ncbi:hypothetical protein D3C87_687690 [compost metagenome]